jgi:hypothetical protein
MAEMTYRNFVQQRIIREEVMKKIAMSFDRWPSEICSHLINLIL